MSQKSIITFPKMTNPYSDRYTCVKVSLYFLYFKRKSKEFTQMKYSVKKQVEYLKYQKGISFNLISEDEAKKILKNYTYYYKVTCFRKNFVKNKFGKYIDVDFATLNDLAIIDMRLRYLLLILTLDLEHALKTRLIESITFSGEDGYSILQEFDNHEKAKYVASGRNPHSYRSIQSMHMRKVDSSEYDYHLINRYEKNNPQGKPLPVWVFLEKVSYGGLEKFISFYIMNKKNNYKIFKPAADLLLYSKRIRDAAAHNRPILMNIGNNVHAGLIQGRVSSNVESFISEKTGYKKDSPQYTSFMKTVKNTKAHDLLCVFMLHQLYVTSSGIQQVRQAEIDALLNRIKYRQELYANHPQMSGVANFFITILSR